MTLVLPDKNGLRGWAAVKHVAELLNDASAGERSA
jgi:hypothetical protein